MWNCWGEKRGEEGEERESEEREGEVEFLEELRGVKRRALGEEEDDDGVKGGMSFWAVLKFEMVRGE